MGTLFGDMGGLLKQARKMQSEMKRVRKALAKERLTGTSKDGHVRIVLTGDARGAELKIDPKVLEGADAEAVQGSVREALEEALGDVEDRREAEMKRLTGGLGLSGLM